MRSVFAAALLSLLVVTGWVGLTGCQPDENLPFASEVDEPHYRRGTQLLRGGRSQEALEAFLKVIEKRAGDAPESHLECGILYLQHIKDPVAAIYHFRKYLALRPTSPQAPRARELIETAMKEFARTLPAKPFEGQVERLDLMETVERLQKENYQLKEQIAQLRGLPPSSRPLASTTTTPDASSESEENSVSAAGEEEPEPAPMIPVPTPATRPAAAASVTQQSAGAGNTATPATVASQSPAPTGRVHTVQKGDSLFSISRQYYGNGSRVNDIVAANRGLLQDRNTPLKIGMQLKLP
ncbi:MAG TPA: LysM peptidoglycan-binding domain-containing protein [Opitutaceae bacterium]|nr:LysM peptidoglycan-binding domain-containing protein [Opitutaceae bacterium]